jgi:ankyrin repeat protein
VAADEGDLERVRSLIHKRANVNASDRWRWTALHMAAYGGYNDIAKDLIAAGADLMAMTVGGPSLIQCSSSMGVAAPQASPVD